jgi:meiotically up-regulated gene 157 (Mug157) protein
MKRRQFIGQSVSASAALALSSFPAFSSSKLQDFPVVRVAENKRNFTSPAVEETIKAVSAKMGDKELAWLFQNCFPNTLDTTVEYELVGGKPDTYVITGDIDAMWLRDSSAQVWPYLSLAKTDKKLQLLINGVINRQVKCVLKDPYANAFYKDESKVSEWKSTDITDMKAGIHERKWEIDSLCYPIRLSHGYWKTTGDLSIFDAAWTQAMELIIKTFTEQQRVNGQGPYSFQRKTAWATDGVPMGGYGYPTNKVGLIHSMFRPSDDATIYPFLIPANYFALRSLRELQELAAALKNPALAQKAATLSKQVGTALANYSKTSQKGIGEIYAYEVNGYGSFNLMDDANIPSLLGLPYFSDISVNDPVYKNTRKFVLGNGNPFFFKGSAGEGIGGPHIGLDYIWPMSIIMRGLTSTQDAEVKSCLAMLKGSHGDTGFMHESFHKDDPKKFTRKWFAWANTLFGEFILKVYRERPHLLA